GWRSDRPRLRRADREWHETGSDCGTRATRGPAGPVLDVPGVAAGALKRRARVAVTATAGELDHRELRRENGAALLELRDDGRVLADDLIAIGRGAPRRPRAASRQHVLRAIRDRGERPA